MLSSDYKQWVLDALFLLTAPTLPINLEISLWDGAPSLGGTEATGGSYVRMEPTFEQDVANESVRLADTITWVDMPTMTVYWIALHDADSGDIIVEAQLVTPYTCIGADQFVLNDFPNTF